MTRIGELIDRLPVEVTRDATIKQLETEIAEEWRASWSPGPRRLVRQVDLEKSLAQQLYHKWSPTNSATEGDEPMGVSRHR